MVASFLLLADAAEEGRKVVLAMLVVGLIFVAVIALGELSHYLASQAQGPHALPHAVGTAVEERTACPYSVILCPAARGS